MGPITFRPVEEGEQPEALSLWDTAFTETPGFFERYFRPEAGYRPGDTLGAWSEDRLVSAVHLCRRPVQWGGAALLCGGIANVATLPEFRRRGLSRRLLESAVAKMEREGFGFSLLGTGTPGHYATLGWEEIRPLRLAIDINADLADLRTDWQQLGTTDLLVAPYASLPRPLQFDRSAAYFEGWAGWNLRRLGPSLCRLPRGDYLLLAVPEAADHLPSVLEWRAADAAAERDLLHSAAAEVARRGHGRLALDALPQHLTWSDLESLGSPVSQTGVGGMARNIGLGPGQYRTLLEAYRSGTAVWWTADGF